MIDQTSPDFHLTRNQVEIEFGISKRFLELAAVKRRRSDHDQNQREMVRYRRADIEAWLASKRINSTSETV